MWCSFPEARYDRCTFNRFIYRTRDAPVTNSGNSLLALTLGSRSVQSSSGLVPFYFLTNPLCHASICSNVENSHPRLSAFPLSMKQAHVFHMVFFKRAVWRMLIFLYPLHAVQQICLQHVQYLSHRPSEIHFVLIKCGAEIRVGNNVRRINLFFRNHTHLFQFFSAPSTVNRSPEVNALVSTFHLQLALSIWWILSAPTIHPAPYIWLLYRCWWWLVGFSLSKLSVSLPSPLGVHYSSPRKHCYITVA